jgi:hypothetical protein
MAKGRTRHDEARHDKNPPSNMRGQQPEEGGKRKKGGAEVRMGLVGECSFVGLLWAEGDNRIAHRYGLAQAIRLLS